MTYRSCRLLKMSLVIRLSILGIVAVQNGLGQTGWRADTTFALGNRWVYQYTPLYLIPPQPYAVVQEITTVQGDTLFTAEQRLYTRNAGIGEVVKRYLWRDGKLYLSDQSQPIYDTRLTRDTSYYYNEGNFFWQVGVGNFAFSGKSYAAQSAYTYAGRLNDLSTWHWRVAAGIGLYSYSYTNSGYMYESGAETHLVGAFLNGVVLGDTSLAHLASVPGLPVLVSPKADGSSGSPVVLGAGKRSPRQRDTRCRPHWIGISFR